MRGSVILFLAFFFLFTYFSALNAETISLTWRKIEFNSSTVVPPPKEGHIMAYYEDKLYIYGGFDSGYKMNSDIWAFDIETGEWEKVYGETEPEKDKKNKKSKR